jgi:hypothetical protein
LAAVELPREATGGGALDEAVVASFESKMPLE